MRVAHIRGSQIGPWDVPLLDLTPEVDVTVFASRGASVPAPPQIAIRRLRSPADLRRRLGPRGGVLELLTGSLQYLVGLEQALDGHDIAAPIELENPTTVQALRARRRGSVQRVVTTVMENIPYRPSPNRWVEERVREAAAGVDHFIAVTDRARLRLRTAGVEDDRITVLPMGTDLDRFHPVDRRRRDGPVRILMVARLERGKGAEDLLIAVGLLAERGLDAELSFIGRGPLRTRLEALADRIGIADRVRFGTVPWEEIDSVYREADIFVLPSAPTSNWREQFGFAVVEAMASGLPAIVGNSGSLPEVVGRPEALVAPHDPLALAERLEPLVANAALRADVGVWNRRRAEERFDQRRVRDGIRTVYEEALSRPPRRSRP